MLVGGLALPFVLHQNAWYEWANSLWFLQLQAQHVASSGLPTYFIHAAGEYFYPWHVFYSGPLNAVLAYPAALFGAWPVFAAVTFLAFATLSAGVSWTARNLGVPPRPALIPGVLFATTPYMVSDLYGRGAWAELVALASLALATGAATSVLSGRARSTPLVLIVLVLAVSGIAGSHNLTLLLSAIFAPFLALALVPVFRCDARQAWRRLATVAGGALAGAALCGFYLVPNIWLSGRTMINLSSPSFLGKVGFFDRPGLIFNPWPAIPAQVRGLSDDRMQTCVVGLVWLLAVVVALLVRRRLDRRTGIALVVIGATATLVTLLITNPSWWQHFPGSIQAVQFPFRLVSYLTFLIVVGVGVLLTVPAARSKIAVTTLVALTCWQVGLGFYVAASSDALPRNLAIPQSEVRASTTPVSFPAFQAAQFRLVQHNPIAAPEQAVAIPPVGDNTPSTLSLSGNQPGGTLLASWIVASPLIAAHGDLSFAGATDQGFEVLRVKPGSPVPWHGSVGFACGSCLRAVQGKAPAALLIGRLASLLGTAALLGLAGMAIVTRRRRPVSPAGAEAPTSSPR